jgi:hypothetical protein
MKETLYCAVNLVASTLCGHASMDDCCQIRHKWPSLFQFKNKHELEIQNDMPIWRLVRGSEWQVSIFKQIKSQLHKETIPIICTPYGQPQQDYIPNENEVLTSKKRVVV